MTKYASTSTEPHCGCCVQSVAHALIRALLTIHKLFSFRFTLNRACPVRRFRLPRSAIGQSWHRPSPATSHFPKLARYWFRQRGTRIMRARERTHMRMTHHQDQSLMPTRHTMSRARAHEPGTTTHSKLSENSQNRNSHTRAREKTSHAGARGTIFGRGGGVKKSWDFAVIPGQKPHRKGVAALLRATPGHPPQN